MQNANVDFSASVSSIEELLLLDDEQFVRAAYLTLLGRDVDSDGLASYVGHLRLGRDKRELIADLALSEEGRGVAADVTGLSALLGRFGARKSSLSVQLIKRLTADTLSPIQTQLRAIENRLYRFEAHNAALLAQRGAEIAELHRTIRIQSQALEFLRSGVQKVTGVLPEGGFGRSIQSPAASPPVDLSGMTQHARRIFRHLRCAVSKAGVQI
jgi:hypothetical protein